MFEIVKIKDGVWYAEVAPEAGANVICLKYENRDVFVPLLSKSQLDENPYIQGSPLLLPANRTKDGKFSFENCSYTLAVTEKRTGANLHGLLHKMAFEVLENKNNSVSLFYSNKGEIYPFPFEITVTYLIENDKFIQRYDIKNSGEKNMPLTFALHTTFVEPEIFSVPIDACQTKDEYHIPLGYYAPLNAQEQKYVTGSPSKNVTISGYYKSCGNIALIGDFKYKVSNNFNHWILFNGEGKRNILCVEPQCGKTNGLNTDDGKIVLGKEEIISFWTEIFKG